LYIPAPLTVHDKVVAEGKPGSLGCSRGDSAAAPPFPFDVGDGNEYGQRKLELTVPSKCQCDGGERGDDWVTVGIGATHARSGREWVGGADPGTGGTDPMDIMSRFFQWSVGN